MRSIARGKIRNLEKRADYQLRTDQLSLSPEIREKKKEIKENSTRQFKKESSYFTGTQSKDREKAQRTERRMNAVEEAKILFLQTPQLKSAAALNLLDMRKEMEELAVDHERFADF